MARADPCKFCALGYSEWLDPGQGRARRPGGGIRTLNTEDPGMDIKDFDQWAALAKADPDAFEERRKATVEAYIAAAPVQHQQRLRGIQFRVEMERQRASNPLSATIRISKLMWSSFGDLRERLNVAANGGLVSDNGAQAPASSAQILPFQARKGPDR